MLSATAAILPRSRSTSGAAPAPGKSGPYYTGRMRTLLATGLIAVLAMPGSTQTRQPARQPPTPPPVALKTIAPVMACPATLGVGVTTKQTFCDVMTGQDPAA